MYPTASRLNHSCQPNCVATFTGISLQIRAVETVQPGEELTISYTDLLNPSAKRKEGLREQYGFDCKCQKCVYGNEEDALRNAIGCQKQECYGIVHEGKLNRSSPDHKRG